MKNKIILTCIVLFIFTITSCKKEKLEIFLECGTVFVQPLWAKNFKADSLYEIKTIPLVFFNKKAPGLAPWDTTYNTSVQIKFLPNGTGELNGNLSFKYKINLTGHYPQLIFSDIQNLSLVYPFPNSLLNTSTIRMIVESYSNEGCQLYFENGVSYYSSTDVCESSYLFMSR